MSTRRSRHTRPDWREVSKDTILFTLGTAMMTWQAFVVPPPAFHWEVLVFGGVLASGPGALKLWIMRGVPTIGPSSPSADSSQPAEPAS
jgi:hypothetical protein